jgi:SAM-dependent methyltransferase
MEHSDRIKAHYNKHPESDRFDSPHGKLEYERTKAILGRYLPAAPADILDAGGGTGAYSFWLAGLGHRVTFVDLSDVHVATVRDKNRDSRAKLHDIREGSALTLDFAAESFDVALIMGPLYHLPPEERARALREMHRVLRKDGLLVSAYISRFAALMDGYRKGYIRDPVYAPLATGDVEHGMHDSPDDDKYFTMAFMHRPDEVAPELKAAGFRILDVLAVEGLFWTYPHLGEFVEDRERFARLLQHAELIEKESSVMGASAHFLAISAKAAG